MTTPTVLGRTLAWHAIQDPQGGRGLSADGQTLAEMWWSPADVGVRAEVAGEIWIVGLAGARPLRGEVRQGTDGTPVMLYVGGLRHGLARSRDGREFELFGQFDRHRGHWTGFDQVGGDGILRCLGRLGRGRPFEITVTPDARHRPVLWPLLLLWGGLSILRTRRPWLGMMSDRMKEPALRHALDELTHWRGAP